MTDVSLKDTKKAGSDTRPLSFDALPGWFRDDHAAAWACFENTRDLSYPLVEKPGDVSAREFFETHFTLKRLGNGRGHLTGYYEPEIAASRVRTNEYPCPIYACPQDAASQALTREAIIRDGALDGLGLEIAWLRDPVDAFFLQVQGSGRLMFADGQSLRVGFAAKNGHPYVSIGAELVRKNVFAADEVSADKVKSWLRTNGPDLLLLNPSFVFFKVLDLPQDSGPLGAMDRPVTTDRTLAVDPAHIPLGTPVWIEFEGHNRLCVAQDIGSAIKGPNRGDLYCGTGTDAGLRAGSLNAEVTMTLILLREVSV